jgi:predicted transposase YdaD
MGQRLGPGAMEGRRDGRIEGRAEGRDDGYAEGRVDGGRMDGRRGPSLMGSPRS